MKCVLHSESVGTMDMRSMERTGITPAKKLGTLNIAYLFSPAKLAEEPLYSGQKTTPGHMGNLPYIYIFYDLPA